MDNEGAKLLIRLISLQTASELKNWAQIAGHTSLVPPIFATEFYSVVNILPTKKVYNFIIVPQEKPLDKALKFDNGHICKTPPTEIHRFYMQSAESSEFFRKII